VVPGHAVDELPLVAEGARLIGNQLGITLDYNRGRVSGSELVKGINN
jgi:hypothetical protein